MAYNDWAFLAIDLDFDPERITANPSVRPNWVFAGWLGHEKLAAAIMSLTQSERINGRDSYAYLKDVLMRLPTQRAS